MDTNTSIKGDTLIALGWAQGKAMGRALAAAKQLSTQGIDDAAIMGMLDAARANPAAYLDDAVLGNMAKVLFNEIPTPDSAGDASTLRDEPLPYPVWGKDGIDPAALTQMDNSMRLPVSVAGALMPDAHVGYGLPSAACWPPRAR